MIALWVATAYLLQKGKMKYGSLLTALPAAFMSAVSATYILMAEEGFRLSAAIACPIGAGFALVLLCAYVSVFLARVKNSLQDRKLEAFIGEAGSAVKEFTLYN